MADSTAAAKVAPYLPFSTFQTALSSLEQGVPRKLHQSLWRSLSGTAQKNIMASFRFLGFMNDADESMPLLKRLIDAKEDSERKAVMRDVLAAAYPRAIELAAENATAAELREAVSTLNVQGDTARKAVAFFMKAAEWCDLPVSPHWKGVTKRGPVSATRRPAARKVTPGARANGGTGARVNHTPPPPSSNQRIVEIPSGKVTLTIDVNLVMMTDSERTFVFRLIDDMAKWGKDAADLGEGGEEDEDDDYEFEGEDEA